MATVSQIQVESQELGDFLLKVQDELKGLRNLVSQDRSKVDLKVLQTSLQKTENDIKEKTDQIINQLNSQVKTLPSIEENELPTAKYGTSFESLWDMSKREKKQSAHKRLDRPSSNSTNNLMITNDNEFSENKKRILNENEHVIEEVQELKPKYSHFDLSPGQQVKVSRETRALFNPENARNRVALNENYNIQLPLIEKRKTFKMQTHLITGSTIEHLTTLPLAYRRNPTLLPPPIDDMESKHGLLSLIERGLIPPTAKISFEHLPISAKSVKPVYEARLKESAKENTNCNKQIEYKSEENLKFERPSSDKNKSETVRIKSARIKSANRSRAKNSNALLNSSQVNADVNPLPPPATPLATLQLQLYDSSKFIHRFIIQNGRVRTDMQDYSAFKQSYILRWGSIVTIIKYLEDLCQTYSIPLGVCDGLKVSELSRCIDMDLKPTLEELMDSFINKEDVEKLVKAPGRRFKRKGGLNLAAIRIQCAWRRYRDRSSYLQYRKRKWAAGVIALTWLTNVKIAKAREKLKERRIKQIENFKLRQKEFQKNWPKIKNAKRVIIHIPSLGYSESIRDRMRDLTVKENYQMARLCDIMDDNVDVIYVSSIPITEETLQYYSKLFGLKSAVLSGNADDQSDVTSRYKVVIPEALNSFPTHNMSLSTLLKYSPNALERIKNLIKGREAYIVPGIMTPDDLHLAEELNVPILGTEPEISNLYTTKSGSKRIFQSAKVDIPFGEFDIYNKEQLHECFAEQITANLLVQRWLFKLDDENDGRGIAYCDVSKHLSCYNWAVKEMIKFGDKWTKRWAYEPTYVKILEEIPDLLKNYAKPANPQAYPTWDAFQKAFLAQGGVLEAHPPSDSVTAITVSMLIEPDFNVKIISSGDHIHAESQYSCWGYTFPQTSVDPKVVNDACFRIADSCKQRNIIGYVDIDFVTFIDAKTDQQILWATDLNISYSDMVSMSNLLAYMSYGKFDPTTHSFDVALHHTDPQTKKKKNKKSATEPNENTSRFAVMSTKLNHSNLSVIHFSVFFQTCRALGIGYDIKEKQGTIFSLIDSINHVSLGMITVTDNLHTSMQQFSQNLNSLHKEISSANMQGKTNFLMAAQDIKNILALSNEPTSEELSSTSY